MVSKCSRKRAREELSSSVRPEDFTQLSASHPYGVLPSGNRFFVKQNGNEHPLTVELLSTISQFLDGTDLAIASQVSRLWYVVSHQNELWRDLVLQRMNCYGGAGGEKTITEVGPTWKDTYALTWHSCRVAHVPMAVSGVYSDELYRYHTCCSFHLPYPWLVGEDSNVVTVPLAKMTKSRFFHDFEEPNIPVLIRGVAVGATDRWKDPSYVEQHTKGRSFRATSGAAAESAQFSWIGYRDYCIKSSLHEEGPLYLFDRSALEPDTQLWKDCLPDLYRNCPWWDANECEEHDLLRYLGEGYRPDHTWWIAGPRRSGSVFHMDPNGTHAWNMNIVGRKRWIFYPPGQTPPGIHPSPDGDRVALPITVGEWLFQFWAEHKNRADTLECTAMPGDVVFVPHGWWHMAINLDELNIAVTHNYCAKSNLSNVLRFLDTKREQVSGCRDRSESIKPERLYEEFVASLKDRQPTWLQQALATPDWTCRAWKKETPSVLEKAKMDGESSFSFSFV